MNFTIKLEIIQKFKKFRILVQKIWGLLNWSYSEFWNILSYQFSVLGILKSRHDVSASRVSSRNFLIFFRDWNFAVLNDCLLNFSTDLGLIRLFSWSDFAQNLNVFNCQNFFSQILVLIGKIIFNMAI